MLEIVSESDFAQSAREDKLTETDITVSKRAQVLTFILDMVLAVALIFAVVKGQSDMVGTIALLLGGMSAASLFVSSRNRDSGKYKK